MILTSDTVAERLRFGEDSRWEFKRVEFEGKRLAGPRREDLADELAAFANASGGALLLGVTDDREVQGLSVAELDGIERVVVELAHAVIRPAIHIETQKLEVHGRLLLAVVVEPGSACHERDGRAWRRLGSSKRRMTSDERLRLAERRSQARFLWFDKQTVPETGFGSLDKELWKPLLSPEGARSPESALAKMGLLAADEHGVKRATVAGVLLCAATPEELLPNACITATCYRGEDRASGQVDAQTIGGPLWRQIAEAVAFAVRNMRVAAHKTPARAELPQYSEEAIFEAVVNAVVHRDYSVRASRIRLSMFADRLEIQSPGTLPNNLTVEDMAHRQATRNEVLTSVLGRVPATGIRGAGGRLFLMERRGDGVPLMLRETRALAGRPPDFRLVGDSELCVSIPAASLEPTPATAVITVRSDRQPLPAAHLLLLFPNKTWKEATSDDAGRVTVSLHSTHLPMTVFAAAEGCAAHRTTEWIPNRGALAIDIKRLPDGGSIIFPEATGHLPGLRGRLNPIRDTSDRTYLYADNIAINEGQPQPTVFVRGEELQLTDSDGSERWIRIVDIVGRSALVEYRSRPTADAE